MSRTDIDYYKESKDYHIIIKRKDTSFDIGQLCKVPCCEQNVITISIDLSDYVTKIEHCNNFGETKDFTDISEVIDYVKENYDNSNCYDDSTDSLQSVIAYLEELEDFKKPKTADSLYKKAIGYPLAS